MTLIASKLDFYQRSDQKLFRYNGLNDLLLCSLVVFISSLPYLINGLNYLTVIHDNLDSNIDWLKLVSEQSLFSFSSDCYIQGVMENTIPRNNFPDAFKLNALLFYFSEPKVAFLINLVLHKSIAIVSFYLIARDYVFGNSNRYILGIMSLMYSLLPTYSIYGAGSLCGFLLITWSTFRYIETNRKAFLLTFVLLPFTTSIVFFDMFVLPVLVVILFFFYKVDLNLVKKLFLPFLLFIVAVSIANGNTLLSFFLPSADFISHRTEFIKDNFTFVECVSRTIHYFLYGFYHAPSAPKYLAVVFIIFLGFKLRAEGFSQFNKLMIRFFLIQLFFSCVYGFWFWQGLSTFKSTFPFFNVLDVTRLAFLSQPLWYLMFAFVIHSITKTIRAPLNYILISVIIVGQFCYIYLNNREIQANVRLAVGIDYNRTEFISFDNFFITKTYDQVKHDFPDLLSYWTLTVGDHPVISSFNGLNVLDYYSVNYDLRYKRRFKIIIQNELEKNQKLSQYFQGYGSRCYAFASEIYGQNSSPNKPLSLDYNWDAFKRMGGKYVISFYPIVNAKLILESEYKILENPNHDKLFLYKCD